jgi:hypothetical protein
MIIKMKIRTPSTCKGRKEETKAEKALGIFLFLPFSLFFFFHTHMILLYPKGKIISHIKVYKYLLFLWKNDEKPVCSSYMFSYNLYMGIIT